MTVLLGLNSLLGLKKPSCPYSSNTLLYSIAVLRFTSRTVTCLILSSLKFSFVAGIPASSTQQHRSQSLYKGCSAPEVLSYSRPLRCIFARYSSEQCSLNMTSHSCTNELSECRELSEHSESVSKLCRDLSSLSLPRPPPTESVTVNFELFLFNGRAGAYLFVLDRLNQFVLERFNWFVLDRLS